MRGRSRHTCIYATSLGRPFLTTWLASRLATDAVGREAMTAPSKLVRTLRPYLAERPRVREVLRRADIETSRLHHSLSAYFPALIQPRPRQLTIAITAFCNFRCEGCRYGRDFMLGERISAEKMSEILEDAREAGISAIRLYGGEPLTHPEIARIVAQSIRSGFDTYLTSNGLLLGRKIDELYAAGLRQVTIGFYGSDGDGSAYTHVPDYLKRLSRSFGDVRERYGSAIDLQLNYVMTRPFCTLDNLQRTWEFAQQFDMSFHIDLVSWSVPFFTNDKDLGLQFTESDRPAIERVVSELLRLKARHPGRVRHSPEFIRSIPDWLILQEKMRVPCDAYELLWIGADGTVQLCDTAFELGNINRQRLRDILFGEAHRKAARDGFLLKCPNCTCKAEPRIQKHSRSLAKYGASRPSPTAVG